MPKTEAPTEETFTEKPPSQAENPQTHPNPQHIGQIGDSYVRDVGTVLRYNAKTHNPDQVALALYDEFLRNFDLQNPEQFEISDIMAAVRHVVYQLGLVGGPEGIEGSVSVNASLRGKCREEMTPEEYQFFLAQKTLVCLKALGALDNTHRDRYLGLAKARFLKRDVEKVREVYFDIEGKRLKRLISEKTPIDDLLNIVALNEQNQDPEYEDLFQRASRSAQEFLIRKLATSNPLLIRNAGKYFTLRHYEAIVRQMPDTLSEGRIGGKSVGLLMAYAALEKEDSQFDEQFARSHRMSAEAMKKMLDLKESFSENKSVFIGSRVFEDFLAYNSELAETALLKTYYQNGKAHAEEITQMHERIREAIMNAQFPPHIERQLKILFLERLKGKPIIVRSTSELEDMLGASFAGQYESVELANTGKNLEADFQSFKKAILTVYASVFSEDVMSYRRTVTEQNKGETMDLLAADEEMGILIQDLNGQREGKYFYPSLSIVAFSHATQSTGFDPDKGAMKIAAGLGEAIVLDGEGIFVMLDKPLIGQQDTLTTQGKMTVLNMEDGRKEKLDCNALYNREGLSRGLQREAMQVWDNNSQMYRDAGWSYEGKGGVMTFKGIVEQSKIPMRVKYIVQKLKALLGYEVDCEFTVEFIKDKWVLKLVQCRPQSIPENLKPSRTPKGLEKERVIASGEKNVNAIRKTDIPYVLYISPEIFDEPPRAVHSAAQYIRKLNAAMKEQGQEGKCLIFSPRRFGSQDDRVGIPVRFYDFSDMAGFIEVFDDKIEYSPSFGTHFTQAVYDTGMVIGNFKEQELEPKFFKESEHDEMFPSPETVNAVLGKYVKVINVDQACSKISGKKVDGGYVLHVAQDNTNKIDGARPSTIYFAQKGCDLPEEV